MNPGPLCVLRLSAIGDVIQAVPAVRALQDRWPDAEVTWIMGGVESRLVGDLDGVEVIPFRKGGGLGAVRGLVDHFRSRRFQILLHMHPSLRANILSRAVPAGRRLGFDRTRSRELHGLFVNDRIPAAPGAHVLEGFFSFARALGVESARLRWDIPLADEDRRFAEEQVPDEEPTLIVSPASSHPARNWTVKGYAQVIRRAVDRYGMRVLLCGGPSELERTLAREIEEAAGGGVVNLVGRDTLKQFLAVLERATVVVSPDSGPAHMASAVGTPVLGLYAATNPARSGPYRSLRWCVDRFEEAARKYRGRPGSELPWAVKIEEPGVMELVEEEAVLETLDRLMEALAQGDPAVDPPRIRDDATPPLRSRRTTSPLPDPNPARG